MNTHVLDSLGNADYIKFKYLYATLDNFYQTIALGRWGHSFLRYYILPEPYVPFFTTIVSLFFLSAAAAMAAVPPRCACPGRDAGSGGHHPEQVLP
jgi:hypothetical protein